MDNGVDFRVKKYSIQKGNKKSRKIKRNSCS
nr:MAG TPA: hypothetical protein [Caudoviricetes sp.]